MSDKELCRVWVKLSQCVLVPKTGGNQLMILRVKVQGIYYRPYQLISVSSIQLYLYTFTALLSTLKCHIIPLFMLTTTGITYQLIRSILSVRFTQCCITTYSTIKTICYTSVVLCSNILQCKTQVSLMKLYLNFEFARDFYTNF